MSDVREALRLKCTEFMGSVTDKDSMILSHVMKWAGAVALFQVVTICLYELPRFIQLITLLWGGCK